MANQLKMADVVSILTLRARGWSCRRIARELGLDRDTVSRHVRLSAAASGKAAGQEPSGGSKPAPEALAGIIPNAGAGESKPASEALTGILEGREVVGTAGAAGAEPAGRSRSRCAPWRQFIVDQLAAGHSAQRIYQDLVNDHGYPGSYHSVCRLARKLNRGASGGLPFRRMECEAGAEAQVDFGSGARIVGADGKRHRSHVFRIVLSHSRKGYSEAVERQTTDNFLRCLENAFHHFGGVPRTLVIDNLRAAVARADWFEPQLCPKAASFAGHYGMAILPARPYTPRHKGKIERGIGYVKGNALKGRSFPSLAEQNLYLAEWESSVADLRIHGTTRRQVKELFERCERQALLPLPASRFELFQESLRCVHRDGHVEVKRAYYSVPPEFLGQRVWARWDGRVVRIFDEKMRQIALHAQQEPGRFSTHNQHIPPEKISGIERGANWLLERVGRIGPYALAWARATLEQRGTEGMRAVMGLNSLHERHGSRRIDEACRITAGHGTLPLAVIRQLLKRSGPAQEQSSIEFVSEHPIIRPLADYAQLLPGALSLPLINPSQGERS
jgi:transposase